MPQPPQELNNEPSVSTAAVDQRLLGSRLLAILWRSSTAGPTGYWTVAQPDWIWVSAHYVWTPGGYLFIPGHWDYALARRGVMFAPVAFGPGVYAAPGLAFTPGVVIDSGALDRLRLSGPAITITISATGTIRRTCGSGSIRGTASA